MTLTLPIERLRRREQVAAVLQPLPPTAGAVEVRVSEGQPTASFIDELVRQLLVERSVDVLSIEGASEITRSLFELSAEQWDCSDRVRFV
jgi:hypothetical protein